VNRQRSSIGLRAFWVLLWVALAGLAVAAVIAIASGGYRPPADPSGFDPVRAGMLVFFVAGTGAFALVAAGGIVARRQGSKPIDPGTLLFVVGLTVATAAMAPIVAILPAQPGHAPVSMVLRAPLYLGFGLMALAFAWWIVVATRDALRERDQVRLAALALFAGMVAFLMFRN
jgi:hypothetical protein